MRRRANNPTLLVPDTRGPLHNYFHFLIGYFVPIFGWSSKHPSDSFSLTSCPPFDHWFELLPKTSSRIIDPAVVIKEILRTDIWGRSRNFKIHKVSGWDKWERFSSRPLREIADLVVETHQAESLGASTGNRLILGREHVPSGFPRRHLQKYGATRRNIQNIKEVSSHLESAAGFKYIDPATLSPLETVRLFGTAEVLLAQHGAALANMLFCRPGTKIIEITWRGFEHNPHYPIYELLANRLGLHYQRLQIQEDPFSPINKEDIYSQLEL